MTFIIVSAILKATFVAFSIAESAKKINVATFNCNIKGVTVAFMRRKNTTKYMMKQYISESLLLLMENKRYSDISIEEITQKAGVNRSTYYRNFSSKEEVIKFFIEEIMNAFIENYSNMKSKSLFTYLNSLFEYFYKFKAQLILIYQNELFYVALEVFNRIFEKQQPQKFSDNKELYGLYYHIGGIYNFFILWLTHGMIEPPEELTQIAMAIFPPGTRPRLFS